MMLTAVPSAKYAVIHEAASRDDNMLNIGELCEIAGVSRSGYYYWRSHEGDRAERERKDEEDFKLVLEAYKFRGYAKGSRSIHMRLLHLSPSVAMNRKKIQRLMDKFNLLCPIRAANPYRRMAKALQTSRVAPNLLNREFRAHGARMVLLTDITYISRGDGYFSYLSVIMDAYTKEVLSFVLSYSLEVDFVLTTVQTLLANHGPELKTDALIHSDQGCHYTSHKFTELIRNSVLRQSMSRRANCWDNAPQESFFGHMKAEIHLNPSDSHSVIEGKIADWIDYYNKDRYQWNLAKLSPNEYYRYVTTGEYPLTCPPPKAAEGLGGSAPRTPGV